MNWNLIVDVAKCTGCGNCLLAAKDEHAGNEFPGYSAPQPNLGHRWIDVLCKVRGQAPMVDAAYLPVMCQHCENAPCMSAGPQGAVYRRGDGIVMIDPVKAKGCRAIADACPYSAVWWNAELELPQKWFFDAHLLDQGHSMPRCVEVCPTGALQALKAGDGEMAALLQKEGLQVLLPEAGTKPHVFYKALDRFTKCFIGGSVACSRNGVIECVEGAEVQLIKDGMILAGQFTDNYGDFKFEGLDSGSGEYMVRIVHGRFTRTTAATLGESIFLGEVSLDADAVIGHRKLEPLQH
jgi:Fe-S-cluster-containing dehydrogenase component